MILRSRRTSSRSPPYTGEHAGRLPIQETLHKFYKLDNIRQHTYTHIFMIDICWPTRKQGASNKKPLQRSLGFNFWQPVKFAGEMGLD